MKKNVAVILAAGKGERSGFEQPKQMMKLAGKPIIEHTIEAFQNHNLIDEIVVVTNILCQSRVEDIVSNKRFNKVKKILVGGSERFESSLSAINAYLYENNPDSVNLIFHDAVRPLVSDKIISDVVAALEHYNAVDVVVPTTDTIISCDSITNTIDFIPERSKLRNGQTPQGFSLDVISKAYNLALQDPNFVTTDDCGVVLKYLPNEKICLVNGDINNIKLTYKEDLQIIDKLLQLKSKNTISSRINANILTQFKEKTVVIFGGTSGIGEEMANIATAYQAKVFVASRRTHVNITDIDSVKSFLSEVASQTGKIDFIVNAAGILSKEPLTHMSYIDVLNSISVNYIGSVNVAIASYEYLVKSNGQLLNFTSSSYTYGRAFYSLYSSSKAAVVNLTQALAEEWNTNNIRVNCINPERTDTPMRRKAFGIEPTGTLLDAKDVAIFSLGVLLDGSTGQIFDIRKN